MIRSTTCFLLLICITCGLSQAQSLEDTLLKADSLLGVGEFESSLEYFDAASGLAISQSARESYVKALLGKGRVYRLNYDNPNYEVGLNYFYQAFGMMEKKEPSLLLAEVYYAIAITERVLNHDRKALEFGEMALGMGKRLGDPSFLAKANNMYGNILSTQRRFEEAIPYYKQAMAIRESLNIPNDEYMGIYWTNLASAHQDLSQYKESAFYHEKTLDIYRNITPVDSLSLTNIHSQLGLVYSYRGMVDRALYHQAQSEKYDPNEGKSLDASFRYRTIGQLFQNLGSFDSALNYFQKALIAGIDNFNSQGWEDNPTFEEEEPDIITRDIYLMLEGKADLLQEKHRKSNDIRFLEMALSVYRSADELLYSARMAVSEDNESLHLAGHSKSIYEKALEILTVLYEVDQNPELLSEIHHYIERSKHLILLKSRLKNTLTGFDTEHDKQLANIQYEISQMRNQMTISELEGEDLAISDSLNNEILRRLYDLERLKDRSVQAIDVNSVQIKDLEAIQEILQHDQMIVNFFWGQDQVYALAITADQVQLHQENSATIEDDIEAFMSAVNVIPALSSFEINYDQFLNSSYQLYQTLFATFLDQEGSISSGIKNIIILPDGRLNNIPFAALVRKKSVQSGTYIDLDYLINHFTLSYSFSGNVMAVQQSERNASTSFIGFSTDELNFSTKELEKVSSYWPNAQLYRGNESTEYNFKKNVQAYDIIHIASHSNPGDSGIEGSIQLEEGAGEDGKLFTYEIYPLELKARLAVLSACQTGIGKHHAGEGVFSLARSFAYAGVPTTVMSLWKISDAHTIELMNYFYSELSSGLSNAEALKNAQLKYLSEADVFNAHPAYWSAFVVMGDGPDVLFEGNSINWTMAGSLGLVLLVSVAFYRSRKRFRTPS